MRLSGNVRQIATAALVCSALIAAGYAPALANNNHHKQHWWEYLYGQVESISRSLGTLGSRLTGRLDSLSTRVDELAAKVAGQANSSLATRIDQLASDLTNLGVKLDSSVLTLNNRIAGLDTGLNQRINDVNTSLNNAMGTMYGRLDSLTARVARLEEGAGAGSSSGRVVVDFNEKKIGEFAGLDGFAMPLVAMSDDAGRTFVLQVGAQRLVGDVYFTGANCTGAPYVFSADKKPMSLAGVKNNVVYVTNANIEPTTVAVMSVSSDFEEEGFCHSASFTINAVPVASQTGLSVVAPFLVK